MTYEANQTVYHMGQGVTFIAYIGDDRALVEVDVYDGSSEAFDAYTDRGSDLYTHSVTVLVDVGALTEKKDDLWPIAKAELAKHNKELAAIKKRVTDVGALERNLSALASKLKQEAKKYAALDTILREMNGEATHYIYAYEWWRDPKVVSPGQYRTSELDIEVRLEKSGGSWKIDSGGFKNRDSRYIPCFGEDDLATKLVAFCEKRIDCNDHSLSVKMEKFCTEYNVTSPKITAAIQRRKDMVEEEKKKRIAKAEAELAALQGPQEKS